MAFCADSKFRSVGSVLLETPLESESTLPRTMLEDLHRVAWAALPRPEWSGPEEIPEALRQLAASATEDEGRAAYSRVLFAFGNNHGGTYYPAVLEALPFLGEILRSEEPWPRSTTLDILIDLAVSFEPEPGFELVELDGGGAKQLATLVREEIEALLPAVREVAEGSPPESREGSLARDLLTAFHRTDDGCSDGNG